MIASSGRAVERSSGRATIVIPRKVGIVDNRSLTVEDRNLKELGIKVRTQ